ncbi:MAG: GAF domain-containing protein [Cyanobacteria bacterium CRU_2_1]|nr:GAF domain-containing protein [Cyanobacteria bacterium RU_5_0]NJR58495.1 GAF domain-containing protein [Cyanobacteria bacterium CRU_2_1]NJR58507.1 GAF domain-containing protein [Cyanobacteria bacterium CRU_2_1]
MSSGSVPNFSPQISNTNQMSTADYGLQRIVSHLAKTLERDAIVEYTVNQLRDSLKVDRVVLYYFCRQWEGRVTFEAFSSEQYSIFGSTGPDECFNEEYAALYLAGRVRAIADIEQEPIQACHRDFLRGMQVRANLVVPILTTKGLWGLLAAHHCQSVRPWSESDIEIMQERANTLASAPAIQES